ncbi:putative choline and nitrogen mustard permease [Xylariaceae sp. FL0016]|nr:putative choline and nitrogen mustard permease [Xylariaceae sp. FL0016]
MRSPDIEEQKHPGLAERPSAGLAADQSSTDDKQMHFSLWSTIGISYSTMATPLSIGTYMAFSIGVGGSPVFIFGYIVSILFQFLVCLSLAEMARLFPHSTGQVHWTSVLAPPRWSRILSYWVGAFTAAGWFFWTVGTYLFSAQLVLAMAATGHPSFEAQDWQVYLCLVGAAVIAVLLNIHLFRGYSLVLKAMIIVVNVGAILVFVVLLARSYPKRSAPSVFTEFVNETGWDSDGFVFLLGCLPGITAINGFDSATHVTDEIPNPSKQIPRVMIWSSALAALAGIPMVIAFMFCVVNQENLLAPLGGQPVAQLIYDSCASTPLALLLLFVYVFVFYVACGTLTTTFSRVLWSLARQRHLFIGSWLAELSGTHELPEHAIYFASLFSCLIGLLCLGPSTALNAILGSAAISFFVSYTIPIACLIIDRNPLSSKPSTVKGDRGTLAVNLMALAWMLLMSVVLLFPQYLPVEVLSMNYTVAVLALVVLVYSLNWVLYAKKHYADPKTAFDDQGDGPFSCAGEGHA